MQKELNFLIMQAILNIINLEMTGLENNDPTKLRLVEIVPKSENFDKYKLTCTISPNDPSDPGAWKSEEVTKWPKQQSQYVNDYGRNFNEISGGQGYTLAFTVNLDLYYQRMGLTNEQVMEATMIILAKIRTAILNDAWRHKQLTGLKDDFGGSVVSSDKAVKDFEVTPRGGKSSAFTRAKMRLAIEVYYEPIRTFS